MKGEGGRGLEICLFSLLSMKVLQTGCDACSRRQKTALLISSFIPCVNSFLY